MNDAGPWARRRLGRSLTTRPLIYGGNRIELLRSGAEFFPRLLAAIDAARHSIHLETYIFELDAVGERVADALQAAAGRGVAVRLLVDAFGSAKAIPALRERMVAGGVRFRAFRPGIWWRLERRLLRRLHRKTALVDDRVAFVGGINIIDDHHHPGVDGTDIGPRYDFAVACEGPLVALIAFVVKRLWWTVSAGDRRPGDAPPRYIELSPPLPENMRAALLLRDNLRNRRTIEHAYLDGIESARKEVLIASAYFLPGRKLIHALCAAAQRGVRVRLLLQGRVEYRLQHYAQQALYGRLVQAGVQIHEYTPSFLHAKVAVFDEVWSTVGSSNIDPYSLLLAREANVAVIDSGFATQLRGELERAIAREAVAVHAPALEQRPWWKRLGYRLAYATVRLITFVAVRRVEQ
ncbi:MAG TPA: cardiolipin synthase ClsB [Burkholderiaceae bacterium]|nr:cardiolipin synthase ClsB [Burkholderiaceae bacterium]